MLYFIVFVALWLLCLIITDSNMREVTWPFKRHPKIWALKGTWTQIWTKVVSTSKPIGWANGYVIGPFQSEADCEEFCDHANKPYLYGNKKNNN